MIPMSRPDQSGQQIDFAQFAHAHFKIPASVSSGRESTVRGRTDMIVTAFPYIPGCFVFFGKNPVQHLLWVVFLYCHVTPIFIMEKSER